MSKCRVPSYIIIISGYIFITIRGFISKRKEAMVRHIVMFKLTAFETPADKLAKMQEIKEKLEALQDKI